MRDGFGLHDALAILLFLEGPLARSLYQADKALKNNHLAVRDGGCIVLEAACPDGVGQDAFLDLLKEARSFAEALARVAARGYRLGDHKAVKLRHLTDTRRVELAFVSPGLDAETCALLGGRKAPSVAEATAGRSGRGVVVDDAGNAVTLVRGR